MTDLIQSTDLQSKLMDWFHYDRDLRHERVKSWMSYSPKSEFGVIEVLPEHYSLTLLLKIPLY